MDTQGMPRDGSVVNAGRKATENARETQETTKNRAHATVLFLPWWRISTAPVHAAAAITAIVVMIAIVAWDDHP